VPVDFFTHAFSLAFSLIGWGGMII